VAHDGGRGTGIVATRLARALLVLLVLTGLVAGLVVGLVALATRWSAPTAQPVQPVCTADVASPDADGARLRARLAPDQTANAALVVGVAHRRGLPARAATIGIATAIQESGLRNIDYGDRDSLGLFQQRPSQGWGSEEQVQDPLYATGAFYDALVQVDGYADLEITDAAQEVQRSGFPEAYADHEGEGRALASSLYGLSPASLTCDLRPLPDDLAPETPDPTTGLTPRAAALLGDVEAFGPSGWQQVAAQPVAAAASEGDGQGDGDGEGDGGSEVAAAEDGGATEGGAASAGLVVELATDGAGDPARTAWALGHTLVALADRHGVLRVEVGGQVWDRAAPGQGWTTREGPSGPTEETDPTAVRVTVG
jgi:hypothetical protein